MEPHDDALDPRIIATISAWLPDLLHLTHPRASDITLSFLGNRKNDKTQAAYIRILKAFLLWVERAEFTNLAELTTLHISNYIRSLQRQRLDDLGRKVREEEHRAANKVPDASGRVLARHR